MAGKIVCISGNKNVKNTAGFKAPDDIRTLCMNAGWDCFDMPVFPSHKNAAYRACWLLLKGVTNWNRLLRIADSDTVFLFQHPQYGKRFSYRGIKKIQKKKHSRFIALIHDLESLRGGVNGQTRKQENTSRFADDKLLGCFDVIICHNEKMKTYLEEQGFSGDRLVTLGIFDYLCETGTGDYEKKDFYSIDIAGNLRKNKSGYIYSIGEEKILSTVQFNLYGNNCDEKSLSPNMKWLGSFLPNEIPGKLHGDFGLVWDGDRTDTCAGNTGAYLKYNNPHKASLYLASGIPVIVWKESALADFVLERKVGIAVGSLTELEDRLNNLSVEEYLALKENVKTVSEQIRQGHHFYEAMKKAQKSISV